MPGNIHYSHPKERTVAANPFGLVFRLGDFKGSTFARESTDIDLTEH
jgi:hypothetical protein